MRLVDWLKLYRTKSEQREISPLSESKVNQNAIKNRGHEPAQTYHKISTVFMKQNCSKPEAKYRDVTKRYTLHQKKNAAPGGWPEAADCIEERGTPRQYGQRNAPAADTPSHPHRGIHVDSDQPRMIIQEGGANVK